jgi:HK97 family phage major capsid protein
MEGGAIPIGSLSISSTMVNKYKLAEILTTTMELKERSVVDIEALFRRALTRAYSRVLDNALLDTSNAVAGVRPAGLRSTAAAPNGNGATTATGNATGGVASVTADVSAMVGALLANNQGAVPVLLMNNRDRMALSFVTSALGEFMFQDQLGAGMVLGVPVVSSAHVTQGTAVMVDVSSLAMILDMPMFDVSQVAAVVEADAGAAAPTMADDGSGAVGTAGQVQAGIPLDDAGAATAPAVAVGSTARSLWQTWSEGIRLIAPTSFLMMRSGVVTTRTTIQWQ